MIEEWKDIPGEPGYQASTQGRIRSLRQKVRCKGGFRTIRGQILTAFISRATGYYQVAIRGRRHSVHRLVALTWCAGHFPGAVVDHKNADRSDNRAENLEWVTRSENNKRGFINGRENPFMGRFSSQHPTSKPVIATCIRTGAERRYESAMDAVREGFDSGGISKCCAGKIRHHKGHYWRLVELTETERGGFLEAQERWRGAA